MFFPISHFWFFCLRTFSTVEIKKSHVFILLISFPSPWFTSSLPFFFSLMTSIVLVISCHAKATHQSRWCGSHHPIWSWRCTQQGFPQSVHKRGSYGEGKSREFQPFKQSIVGGSLTMLDHLALFLRPSIILKTLCFRWITHSIICASSWRLLVLRWLLSSSNKQVWYVHICLFGCRIDVEKWKWIILLLLSTFIHFSFLIFLGHLYEWSGLNFYCD